MSKTDLINDRAQYWPPQLIDGKENFLKEVFDKGDKHRKIRSGRRMAWTPKMDETLGACLYDVVDMAWKELEGPPTNKWSKVKKLDKDGDNVLKDVNGGQCKDRIRTLGLSCFGELPYDATYAIDFEPISFQK